MIPLSALVLYKRSVHRVVSFSDGKLVVENEAGEQKKLREKDILLVHPGPVNRIPQALDSGDFETAHAMLLSENQEGSLPLDWKELSELVFGEYSAPAALSCLNETLKERLFVLGEKGPLALSFAEIEKLQKKEAERRNAENRRNDFINAFKTARAGQSGPLERSQDHAS
ncbi:MAG: hypothetical protein PHT55_04935, partial [Spirochaetales bacterium]|nr:hypothetical protein [Spirochaetales bacterium]